VQSLSGAVVEARRGLPGLDRAAISSQARPLGSEAVHEKVDTAEPVMRLSGDLLHDSAETLEKYLDKQNRYTSLQAEALRSAGRRASVLQLVFSPSLRFVKFYLVRLGFLDGVPGLVHIAIGCMNTFNKYAKLKALERAPK